MKNKVIQTVSRIVVIISLLFAFNGHSSESTCFNFYSGHADVHSAINFFKKFRNDYLPFGYKRASRKKDKFDIYLLEQSYLRGSLQKPVEMGLVELLDKKGNVLDYESVTGVYHHIYGLNMTARNLLYRNHHQLDKIYAVRKRHTHPKDLSNSIIPEAFSDGDMNSDKILRAEMNSTVYYKKIRLESWITYLNINLYTHDPVELLFSDVKIRGYLVE